jgi:hypothetical protein
MAQQPRNTPGAGGSRNPRPVVAIRLPRTYDAARLASDLAALEGVELHRQPGPYHSGEWRGISLRSMGGEQAASPSFPGLSPYLPTDELTPGSYFAEILDELPCPKQVVRLMTLPPGGEIGSHFDLHTNFQFGLLRLHVPIETNPDVHFEIGGESCRWQEGELWYGDFSTSHSVRNDGPARRVHMVIDVEISDALLEWFPPDFVAAQEELGISRVREPVPMTTEQLRRFECKYRIPGDVMPLLAFQPLRESLRGADASLRLVGDRLVTHIEDAAVFAHRPIADDSLDFMGFSSGARMQFRFDGERAQELELILRGLPKNLAAGRLGVRTGPALPLRMVTLPLL